MASTITRQQRQATPARWRNAVERAISENFQVRQLAGSGAWIATSGSDSSAAYELDVTGEVANGCNCLAGLNGDPVYKHRAAYYLTVGLLDPEPEPWLRRWLGAATAMGAAGNSSPARAGRITASRVRSATGPGRWRMEMRMSHRHPPSVSFWCRRRRPSVPDVVAVAGSV